MGLATNSLILYFCILFALYLAVPDMDTGFTAFVSGDYSISWGSVISLATAGLAGLAVAVLTRDFMTAGIVAILTAITGWIVIPTDFAATLPYEIRTFITVLFALIWGMAMIGFFRGYEP